MDALKKNLNYIALALIIAALTVWIVWPQRLTLYLVIGGFGILSLVLYALLNLSSLRKRLRRKSFIYSGNTLLVIVLVLAILGLLNHFLSKEHVRLDFTTAKIHSLSDQSVTVLKNLKADVTFKG